MREREREEKGKKMEKMLKAHGERMDKQEVEVKVKEMSDKVD